MQDDFGDADKQQQEAGDSITAVANQESQNNDHQSFHSPGECDHSRMHLDSDHDTDEKDGRKEEDLFRILEASVEAEEREAGAGGIALAELERDRKGGREYRGGERDHCEIASPAARAKVTTAKDVVCEATDYCSDNQQRCLLVKNLLIKNQRGC